MKKTDNKRIDDILEKARESLEEFGDLHDEGCSVNFEDQCDCAIMDALEKEVLIALQALDREWIENCEEHSTKDPNEEWREKEFGRK